MDPHVRQSHCLMLIDNGNNVCVRCWVVSSHSYVTIHLFNYCVNLQAFKQWLLNVGNHLISMDVNFPANNGKRMCSVLVLTHLLHNLSQHDRDINPGDVSMLLSMLCLKPTTEQNKPKCEELQLLQSFIPVCYHEKIGDILSRFINHVLHYHETCMQCRWLYVIPLVHIFKRKTLPFASMHGRELKWMDDSFVLGVVKQNSSIVVSRYAMDND